MLSIEEIKIKKRSVDYTEYQPRCKQCLHRKPLHDANSNWCIVNEFRVVKSAVCNRWTNKEGETLE